MIYTIQLILNYKQSADSHRLLQTLSDSHTFSPLSLTNSFLKRFRNDVFSFAAVCSLLVLSALPWLLSALAASLGVEDASDEEEAADGFTSLGLKPSLDK